ncbi:disease resistance protein RGA4-like [Phragmites australis]|uniref:disease resistance protein RGA4-like n=1 Tax=Phragmites australis TaxID=29695 RepID=UPI002D77800B|nr:disease resistance protein RGA4-like [Phragmites australis]
MDAAIVSAVLNFALPKIYEAIKGGRRNQRQDLEDDVRSIETEFKFIEAAIKDYRNDPSYVREAWIKALRCLAYDIEDCADRFLPPIFGKEINRRQLADKIGRLKKLAEGISESLRRYIKEKQGPLECAPSSALVAPPTPSSYPQGQDGQGVALDDLVGMEEHLHDLRALVMSPSERKLKVISIVGFGGMGKTLLADLVYRDTDVRKKFPLQAFVLSAGKDKHKILEEIIEQLQAQGVKGKGVHVASASIDVPQVDKGKGMLGASTSTQAPQIENGLFGEGASTRGQQIGVHDGASASGEVSQHMNDVDTRLRLRLAANRYFIVIDDVQTKELGASIIDAFRRAEELEGRIIVTTTIQKVATSCSSGHDHVYKMRRLDDEKAKELFFKQVSKMGPLPGESEQESWDIWKKCDGVPLALVSIAQSCNGDLGRCRDAWRELCTCTTERDRDYWLGRMKAILHHSYDSLSGLGLEVCLLYFCLFPYGHPIRRASLIRRWLAEGLVVPEVEGSKVPLADAAVENFKTLIERNVIWPIPESYNQKVKTCQSLGMMLDYVSRKSESEGFIMLSCDETCEPEDIRRLSLHHTGAADDGSVLFNNDLRRLRTLAVFRSNEGKAALNFSSCVLLRVLDLAACHGLGSRQLKEICKLLRLLKYLSLRAEITVVPREIARLQCLETLDLGKKREEVVTVPAEVLELPNLKYLLGKLKLRKYRWKRNLETFLKQKSKLETLAGFVTTGRSRDFPQLMCHMSRLRKVKMWCVSHADGRTLTHDFSKGIKEFLCKAKLTPRVPHSLSIDFRQCTVPFLNSINAPNDLPAKEDSGSIASLKLRGDLSQIPAFVANLLGIKEVCLSSTTLSLEAILAGLSNLSVLQYLKLDARNIDGDVVVIRPEQFKGLKRMCIVAEQSLPRITIEKGALKLLVSLHLLCQDLDGLSGVQIQHLMSLKEVALHRAVTEQTKDAWKAAARGHPKGPNVLLIDPRRDEEPTQLCPPTQASSGAARGTLSNVATKSRQIAGAIFRLGAGAATN